MNDQAMKLQVLLPHQVHLQCEQVVRIVVQTRQGSMGILPHRRDAVAVLVPGLFCYQLAGAAEQYLAVDAGLLVKTGMQVCVSVRNACGGTDLEKLRQHVARHYLQQDEQEQRLRAEMLKLESGFLRRYLEFQRGR